MHNVVEGHETPVGSTARSSLNSATVNAEAVPEAVLNV
jgi:hypothetical protein